MIKILYAEDDEDDYEFFRDALKEIPLETQLTHVKDGSELMELLKNPLEHDILFLDINMPLKNGYQCVTEIRANQKFNNLPIVIFTTTSAEGIIKWLHDLGANLFIKKPTDAKAWTSTIQKALQTDFRLHTPDSSLDNFVLNQA